MRDLTGKKHLIERGVVPMDYRALILNRLPKHHKDKKLPPIGRQAIFVWDIITYMKENPKHTTEALEYVNKHKLRSLLPTTDMFLVDLRNEDLIITRIYSGGADIIFNVYMLKPSEEEMATPTGTFMLDASTKSLKIDPSYLHKYGRVFDQDSPRIMSEIMEQLIVSLYTFLHSLDLYEVVERNVNTKIKSKPSARRTAFDGPLKEVTVDLKNKRVRYVDPRPVSVPNPDREMGPEFDRRSHKRTYKSGKVVYVKSCTVNKGSPKGRINHTYNVQGKAS